MTEMKAMKIIVAIFALIHSQVHAGEFCPGIPTDEILIRAGEQLTMPGNELYFVTFVRDDDTDRMGSDGPNTCHVLNYNYECDGFFIQTSTASDFSKTVNIYAYNSRLNNVVHYEEKWTVVEQPESVKYAIYESQVNRVHEIQWNETEGRTQRLIDDSLRGAQNDARFALIEGTKDGSWGIYMTCDRTGRSWAVAASRVALDLMSWYPYNHVLKLTKRTYGMRGVKLEELAQQSIHLVMQFLPEELQQQLNE